MKREAVVILGVFVICLLAVAAGCASNSRWIMPTAQQLSTERSDLVDVEALGRGRAIAMTACSECHRQYWPVEYRTDEWPGILEVMGERASLSGEDLRSVTLYLTVASDFVSDIDIVAESSVGTDSAIVTVNDRVEADHSVGDEPAE